MLGSARLYPKQVDSLSRILISRPGIRYCNFTNQSEGNVFIPPRIERGPTDILKALASTVGLDYTAFHYKYPDDPHFYSYSEYKKRILGLSIESGRKSARWIFKNNPKFFKNQLSDPPIGEFLAKPDVIAEAEPTEETLLSAIKERNVSRAIEVYEALESGNCGVSESTKQCLLELTCFYNSKERPNDSMEEKWFLRDGQTKKEDSKWMNKGFAQTLFEKMDSSCSLANAAIIQGMLKYNEVPSAQEIFEAAKVKKVKFPVSVYNLLLSKLSEVTEGENVIKLIEKVLNEMSQQNVRPNLATLNASLMSTLWNKRSLAMSNFSLKLMAEFERLGIEPSLGSYGYLLRIISFHGSHRRNNHELCYDIMAHIENRMFEILHRSDFKFFNNALVAFSAVLGDPDLVMRLLDMFFRNNNSKFIVSFQDEVTFFHNSSVIIFEKKPIEDTMDFYRRYFFTCFSPNNKVLVALISAIAQSRSPQYLLEIWEDLKETALLKNEIFLGAILNLVNDFSDESSLKLFHSVAISYLALIKGNDFKSENPNGLSDILISFVKNGDEENVLNLLSVLKNHSALRLNRHATEALYNYGLSEGKVSLLLDSLKIAAESNLPSVGKMARKALPFLEGDAKSWAAELIDKEKNEKSNES